MRYEVISRFFDKERGVYVDPGTPCPRLSRREAARLVKAHCLAPLEEAPATPAKGSGGKGKDEPATPTTTEQPRSKE